MDLSNKESPIYSYITRFSITCIVSLFIIEYCTSINNFMGLELETIRHIFWNIMLIAWGTKEIFVEKQAYGYIWYLAVLADVIKFIEKFMDCDVYNLRMFCLIAITFLGGYQAVFIEKRRYGYIYFVVFIGAVGAVYKHFFSI